MNHFLTHLKLSFNKELILKEMETITFDSTLFGDELLRGLINNPSTPSEMRLQEMDNTPETKKLYIQLKTLTKSNDIRARFFKQLANQELPFHQDKTTLCSINIVLSEEYNPIIFEGVDEIYYKCALINTQPRHGVKAHSMERIILKFSIFDKSYKEVYDSLIMLKDHDR